ncbi:CCHC-type domain-containing protein [Trichonephila inaurata madagascariensis]|uniref:CCHC-type domain-containing protein n=1 Tax=Trichonephila inaurata madagascariensis TaxID=2747483 RepID=A0A8X6Y1Q4_9ARAC|nr:CCHC-type domain-containing protein [Trichonephila inaurata madagascariensis]
MAFLIRSRKIDLIQLAQDLDESPDPSMSKIVLRDLITSRKSYDKPARAKWNDIESASTIYLKSIFGPAVKCPLIYVPIGLATGGQVNVVHQQVLCALAEVLVEDVLLPPDVLDILGGAQSEENSLAQSSQDLRVDSGNVDETEVSSGILPEKAQENVEDCQKNITSCRNEVGTFGTKDEEVTAEMDKGSMTADSFRSEQECCAQLALAWKHAKEGKGNYYEVGRVRIYFLHLETGRTIHTRSGSGPTIYRGGPGNDRGDQTGRDRTRKSEKMEGEKNVVGGRKDGWTMDCIYHLDIFFFL